MTVRLAPCGATGINAGLRVRLTVIRFGLWVGFTGLLYWTVCSWKIFASPIADALFKTWLLIYALVNSIQILIYRALTQVRVPETLV